MGQVALGLRSLLVRAAVFFVMAALLAWALGGTLWPRAERARTGGTVAFADAWWHWELSVGGRTPGRVAWRLMRSDTADGDAVPFAATPPAADVAELLVADGALWAAYRPGGAGGWVMARVDRDGATRRLEVPDRLAVEQQLARLAGGLPPQAADVIDAQRPLVLDPPAAPRAATPAGAG